MNDSTVVNDVREYWKCELRFLPISAAIAIAVGAVVWFYRLDQVGNPFLLGLLFGALLSIVGYGCVATVYFGAILSGAPRKSSLLQKAFWLVRSK